MAMEKAGKMEAKNNHAFTAVWYLRLIATWFLKVKKR